MIKLSKRILVLGGRTSGKSAFAERLMINSEYDSAAYIASAKIEDDEMMRRVEAHKVRREGYNWHTYEEDIDLIYALEKAKRRGVPVLIECLSLWVSNLMYENKDTKKGYDKLINYIANFELPIIFVSLEVGFGGIPMDSLEREYSDRLGDVNKAISNICDEVYLIIAGNEMKIK